MKNVAQTTPDHTIPAIPKQDVLGRLAALASATTADLKDQWRSLFGAEPPPYNRKFLESRLAYRIQELAYGGLKPVTVARLEALGEQIDGKNLTLAGSGGTNGQSRAPGCYENTRVSSMS